MTKVVLISHNPSLLTGYGRVTRELSQALCAAGFKLVVIGLRSLANPTSVPYRVVAVGEQNEEQFVAQALREINPDVAITLGDPWMFRYIPALIKREGVKWAAYFPIDGFPMPKEWGLWLKTADAAITFSHFAQQVVAKATGEIPKVLYHGVDCNVFAPQNKVQAKAIANVAGKFVVGTVARNQHRKNLPALINAFARFSSDKSDVLLYLHTQLRGYWDLYELAVQYGIKDKTRITAELAGGSGIPDAMLATVYNAMDIFVLPTMAEGFGLPIIEAQACGTPVLVTDFSACSELVPDPIQRLKVKDTLVMRRNLEQAIVDVDDIVVKLQHFYRNRNALHALGARCHQFAQSFKWSTACEQFVALIAALNTSGKHYVHSHPRNTPNAEKQPSAQSVFGDRVIPPKT